MTTTNDIRSRILKTICGLDLPSVVLVIPAAEGADAFFEEFPAAGPGQLEWMQKRVGGYVERVCLYPCSRKHGSGLDVLCNEDGLSQSRPVANSVATAICHSFGLAACLVGDVVIAGTKFTIEDGEIAGVDYTGLTAAHMEWLQRLLSVYGVKVAMKPKSKPEPEVSGTEGTAGD